MNDRGTEIHLRMEAGATADEVIQEMGSPKEVAERFNEEMGSRREGKIFFSGRSYYKYIAGCTAYYTISGTCSENIRRFYPDSCYGSAFKYRCIYSVMEEKKQIVIYEKGMLKKHSFFISRYLYSIT